MLRPRTQHKGAVYLLAPYTELTYSARLRPFRNLATRLVRVRARVRVRVTLSPNRNPDPTLATRLEELDADGSPPRLAAEAERGAAASVLDTVAEVDAVFPLLRGRWGVNRDLKVVPLSRDLKGVPLSQSGTSFRSILTPRLPARWVRCDCGATRARSPAAGAGGAARPARGGTRARSRAQRSSPALPAARAQALAACAPTA